MEWKSVEKELPPVTSLVFVKSGNPIDCEICVAYRDENDGKWKRDCLACDKNNAKLNVYEWMDIPD